MTHTHKIKNGIKIELTADEITVLENQDTQWNDGVFDRALDSLRKKRNNLLAQTDWTANSDVTMSEAMTTYRQELRDLPSTVSDDDEASDVDAITFPTKP